MLITGYITITMSQTLTLMNNHQPPPSILQLSAPHHRYASTVGALIHVTHLFFRSASSRQASTKLPPSFFFSFLNHHVKLLSATHYVAIEAPPRQSGTRDTFSVVIPLWLRTKTCIRTPFQSGQPPPHSFCSYIVGLRRFPYPLKTELSPDTSLLMPL